MTKKPVRRKKTKAEIKETEDRQKKKLQAKERKDVLSMAQDREGMQADIRSSIEGVAVLSKTLADGNVSSLIPEGKFKEAIQKIDEFKEIANKNVPVIRDCVTKMQGIEEELLKNPKEKEKHMMNYTLIGTPMIDAINQIACASIDTTVFCSGIIEESIPKQVKEVKND